jgi:cysteine desulfurase
VLYIRRGIAPANLIEGGGQERGKRPGTENLPGIVGMAAALEEATSQMSVTIPRVTAMRERLIEGLAKIPGSILNGDRERRLPGIVNFCFDGVDGETLVVLLSERGIMASSGSACMTGSREPSHVLTAIGRDEDMAKSALRLSIDDTNTEEEIDYILKTVPACVEYLRSISPRG